MVNLNPFVTANNISNDDALCLRLLADTHRHMHAFTLAEYYYVKTKTVNLEHLQCLVEQQCNEKCQEAIAIIPTIESDATLTTEEKSLLIEIFAKYEIITNLNEFHLIKLF